MIGPESPMLHTTFYLETGPLVLEIYGRGGQPGNVTQMQRTNFPPTTKFGFDWQSGLGDVLNC